MSSATLESPPRTGPDATQTTGALALVLQEAFTVAVRLRANRQVAADADSFRIHVKQLLAAADQDARRFGYHGEYVKRAVYAYIAFLDESVLNSAQPMFAAWPRQPLQEEIFGDHVAGETFFRHLHELLGQQDSPQLADVLEVYQLCLLLGFRGKYALDDPTALGGLMPAIQQKITRIRGGPADLSPAWQLPANEAGPITRDPWVRRLALFAVGSFVSAVSLFVVFRLVLNTDLAALQTLTSPLLP